MTVTGFHSPSIMSDQRQGGSAAALPAHLKPGQGPAANGLIHHYQKEQQPQQYAQSSQFPPQASNFLPAASTSSHSRTRTASSSVFPNSAPSPPPKISNPDRRFSSSNGLLSHHQPSSTGSSTMASTPHQSYVQRSGTNNSTKSIEVRRSASSRTTSSLVPSSYVALMRKQKATVWCDRSQTLDSHTAAQQKAAKYRAALEVHGAANSPRTSTIASSKVRSTKAGAYAPANVSAISVPVRLSANETLGDEEETLERRSLGGDPTGKGGLHQRSSSGRSSVHSGTYPSGYPRSNTGLGGGRFSAGSTPPSGNEAIVNHDTDQQQRSNLKSTSVSTEPWKPDSQREPDYFANPSPSSNNNSKDKNLSKNGTPSSSEEDRFGEAGELKSPPWQSAVSLAAEQARRAEDLRRRGSVDERTMTMGMGVKGRLFVANPDLND